MPVITLETLIDAPVECCFDLSRDIDLHARSMGHTDEKAVAGRTSGLIGLDETVTWEAKHLGIRQRLTSKITEFDYPNYFVDEQVSGAFKSIRHEHHFIPRGSQTLMKDVFNFESPFSILGRLANMLFLTKYMTRLLQTRNQIIKRAAETDK